MGSLTQSHVLDFSCCYTSACAFSESPCGLVLGGIVSVLCGTMGGTRVVGTGCLYCRIVLSASERISWHFELHCTGLVCLCFHAQDDETMQGDHNCQNCM